LLGDNSMDKELKDALQQILGSKAVWVLTQLAVGIGLLYVIVKFFKEVEERLHDDTKLEIAVWLLGVKTAAKVQTWPDTFAKVFDRVFGTNHLSWRCFWRSCLASYAALIFFAVAAGTTHHRFMIEEPNTFVSWPEKIVWFGLFFNVIPDYVSLLKTRYLLKRIVVTSALVRIRPALSVLAVDLLATSVIASLPTALLGRLAGWQFLGSDSWIEGSFWDQYSYAIQRARVVGYVWVTLFPAFFTSIWLWLYAGSGFILKGARYFDRYLGWFNRRFDIEKKPLSSIGLVAGGADLLDGGGCEPDLKIPQRIDTKESRT